MDSTPKPSFPEGYKVPEVWEPKPVDGTWGSLNAPTAGARFEGELPRGKHAIQVYSQGTPNGQKLTILLEELGVEYDAWKIDIFKGEQFSSGFVKINPNSKIPAALDYEYDPPLEMFESGSILLQLATKYAKFLPEHPHRRAECLNWLFWQMGTAPYLEGGFQHFTFFAPVTIEYAIDRFSMETKRIIDVLNRHLKDREYICGDEYTIADMALHPWMQAIARRENASEFLQFQSYVNVTRWIETVGSRVAVSRGMRVGAFTDDAIPERHSPADFERAES